MRRACLPRYARDVSTVALSLSRKSGARATERERERERERLKIDRFVIGIGGTKGSRARARARAILLMNEIFFSRVGMETHLVTVYRYFPRCIPKSWSFILIENSNIHGYLNKPDRISESVIDCAHTMLAIWYIAYMCMCIQPEIA